MTVTATDGTVEKTLDLLPYEFARVNRVLLRASEGDVLVGPDAPDWAISEVVATQLAWQPLFSGYL